MTEAHDSVAVPHRIPDEHVGALRGRDRVQRAESPARRSPVQGPGKRGDSGDDGRGGISSGRSAHGSVGDLVAPMIAEAVETGAAEAVSGRWRLAETVAGFGHPVYREEDPRAEALWPFLQTAWPRHPVVKVAAEMAALVTNSFRNIDFALGTLVAAAGMVPGAAEAIFAVARTAGWLAHGSEEYGHRLRYRLRAAYTGPAPGGAASISE